MSLVCSCKSCPLFSLFQLIVPSDLQVSGQTPNEPVISAPSGLVFERALIVKYIQANGKCPITNEPLAESDLVALKVNKLIKPRPATATSIPNMLQLFQVGISLISSLNGMP